MPVITCFIAHTSDMQFHAAMQSPQCFECYQKTSKHFASSITPFEMPYRAECTPIITFSARELTLSLQASDVTVVRRELQLERSHLDHHVCVICGLCPLS